jgi:hypothetical protein
MKETDTTKSIGIAKTGISKILRELEDNTGLKVEDIKVRRQTLVTAPQTELNTSTREYTVNLLLIK